MLRFIQFSHLPAVATGVCVAGGLAWGCGSREPIERGGVTVGRVVYHVLDDQPFCENDARYLNDAVEMLETTLDRRTKNWIHYYRLQGSLKSRCEGEVSGCADTDANSIYTNFPALAHELVHMITDRTQEHLPYFREGLAESLGEFGGLKLGEESSVFARRPALADMLEAAAPRRYETPAATMAALLGNKGVARTLEFYDHLGTQRSENKLAEALARIDLTTDQLLQLHDDQVATGLAGYPTLRCSAEPARFDAATNVWSFEADVGCNAGGHRRDKQWAFVYRRTVELEHGFHFARAVTPAGTWLSVTPCESGTNLSGYDASDEGGEVWAVGDLSAGVHSASVSVPDDVGTQPVKLSVEPLSSEPYTVSANTTLRLFSADMTRLAIELTEPRRVHLLKLANSVKGAVSLCTLQPPAPRRDGGTQLHDGGIDMSSMCKIVNNDEVIELSEGRYALELATSEYNVAEFTFWSTP